MTNLKFEQFFHQDTATWSYAVYSTKDKSCVIIDSVTDFDIVSGKVRYSSAEKIINFIKENDLNVKWVVDTHVHADHLTGMSYLKKVFDCKTGIGAEIKTILRIWSEILQEPALQHEYKAFDHLFEDNETVHVGDLSFKVINTPGHTPGDVTYVFDNLLFVGDLMFLPDVGTGRCDFPGGNAENAYNSIHRVFQSGDDCLTCVGHDYPTAGRDPQASASIKSQKSNISVAPYNNASEYAYAKDKNKKDSLPRLLLPSVQFNIKGGRFDISSQGVKYIKIPINVL